MVKFFLIFGNEDRDHLPVLVSGGCKDKLLGISKLFFGAKRMNNEANAIYDLLEARKLTNSLSHGRLNEAWVLSVVGLPSSYDGTALS
jgi:hypothetical protein